MCRAGLLFALVGVITVLVADGQRLFGECMALMIDREVDIDAVREKPTTGPEAVAATARHRPDVVLLDYWIPGPVNGALVAREIRALARPPAVLLLSWMHGAQHAQAALDAGASGFLPKSLSVPQLLVAIRRAHLGDPLVYAEQLAALLDDIDRRGEEAEDRWARLCSLSPAEFQLLQQLSQGRPAAEVAAELAISTGTLKNRLHRIYRKLGVKTQLEAVTMARRERLFPETGAPGTAQYLESDHPEP